MAAMRTLARTLLAGSLTMLGSATIAGCGDAGGGGGGGSAKTAGSPDWFTDITAESGIDFVHDAGATGERMLPEIMGAGCALFDADGDGDLDAYFTNGSGHLRGEDSEPDIARVNRFFVQDSEGRFTDATDASGLGDDGYGMGIAIGDIDNDGDLDVYLTNYGPDRLYRNRGDGTFVDVSRAAGVGDDGWGCSAAFVDYDRDGWLDLYVTRYVAFDPDKKCFEQAGRRDYCGPKEYPPVPDLLLHNEGDGTFRDVSTESGIASVTAAGLGVVAEDLNCDGWPDLYVANDAYANHLWINQRDGTFTDEALVRGAAFNLNGQAEAGMGVLAADLDVDGHIDLYVTHLGQETNTLYRKAGGSGGFLDATGVSGLGPSSMALTGFGTAALDAEHDGDLDLIVANGRVFRGRVLPGGTMTDPWDEYAEPNLFYINEGAGRFVNGSGASGPLCDVAAITRGVAVGDVDGDGDLDVLVSNIQGPARLYRNDAANSGRWLRVRATDPRLNRDAIGARIEISGPHGPMVRTISNSSSYLSAGPAEAHFGLGDETEIRSIEVRWPDGVSEHFPGFMTNQVIELTGGDGAPMP